MSDTKEKAQSILLEWEYIAEMSIEHELSSNVHQECALSVGENLFTDKELVIEICEQKPTFLQRNEIRIAEFCSDEVRSDPISALAIVKSNADNMEFIDIKFRDDKEFVVEAMKSVNIFHFATERLRDDDDIVHAALKHDSSSIEFASDRFKKDKELLLKLFDSNGFLLEHIHPELKNDAEFLLQCWTITNGKVIDAPAMVAYIAQEFIKHISDELKQLFANVHIDRENENLGKEITSCFQNYTLNKQLASCENIQSKRPKI